MKTKEITNTANFSNLSLRDAFYLKMLGGTTSNSDMRFLRIFSKKILKSSVDHDWASEETINLLY